MHPHHDKPQPEGPRHNMLLVGETGIFLSHLPMFMAPHDVQLILEATFDEREDSTFRTGRSIPRPRSTRWRPRSLKSRSYLRRSRDLRKFSGTVFRGHLERGGQRG